MERLKKYKGILIALIVCVLIEAISMRAYAYFSYEEELSSGSLAVGKVSVDIDELHTLGTLTNVAKRSTYDSNTYVGFSVTGRNTSVNTLYYYITVNEGDASETNGAVRIRDDLLKFRLESFANETDYNNGTNETVIFNDKDFGALQSTIINKGSIASDTSEDTTTYYKLYVWINNNVNLCGVKGAGCDYYTIEQYPKCDNVYASIKVGLQASFENKTISSLYDTIKNNAVIDTGIDFSTRTGSNLYYMHGTGTSSDDLSRIYYYRGDVNNNNVVFAGFCWKIVRTTDTGGIKMIYNGVYNSSAGCSTATGINAKGVTSIKDGNTVDFAFNVKSNSLAYMGYSYPGTITMQNNIERNPYESASGAPVASAIFGTDVNYNNGEYTLVNTNEGIATIRHYTCNSTNASTTCAKVRYYYYYNTSNSKYYYIELEGGDNVDDAINSMLNQSTDTYSNVQLKINSWYNTNIKNSYDAYIEDTIWCMERNRTLRSNDGWKSNSDDITSDLNTTALTRSIGNSNAIKLTCDNNSLTYGIKSYTDYYSNRDWSVDQLYYGYGSGNIGSKAALLTLDEAKLAGVPWHKSGVVYSSNYLYTGYIYWTLSPTNYGGETDNSVAGDIYSSGGTFFHNVAYSQTIRPVISLNHGTQIYGGSGTVSDPYIVTE